MKTFRNTNEAHNYFRKIANDKIGKNLDILGFSLNNLKKLSVDELREKLNKIDNFMDDRLMMKSGTIFFRKGIDFDLPAEEEPGLVDIFFPPFSNFNIRK